MHAAITKLMPQASASAASTPVRGAGAPAIAIESPNDVRRTLGRSDGLAVDAVVDSDIDGDSDGDGGVSATSMSMSTARANGVAPLTLTSPPAIKREGSFSYSLLSPQSQSVAKALGTLMSDVKVCVCVCVFVCRVCVCVCHAYSVLFHCCACVAIACVFLTSECVRVRQSELEVTTAERQRQRHRIAGLEGRVKGLRSRAEAAEAEVQRLRQRLSACQDELQRATLLTTLLSKTVEHDAAVADLQRDHSKAVAAIRGSAGSRGVATVLLHIPITRRFLLCRPLCWLAHACAVHTSTALPTVLVC